MGNKLIGGHLLSVAGVMRNGVVCSDMAQRKLYNPITGTTAAITRDDACPVAITPDGLFAIVGSWGSPYLRVVDFEAETWVAPITVIPGSKVYCARFNHNFTELAVGFTGSPFLYRYTYPGFTKIADFVTPPAGRVNGLAYNGDNTKIAIACASAPYIEVFDLVTNDKEAWKPGTGAPTDDALCIAFSNDGTMIAQGATLTAAQRLRVFAYPSGDPIYVETGGSDTYAMRFSPDDTRLAVISSGRIGTTKLQIVETATWTTTSLPMPSYIYDGTSGYGNIRWLDNRFVWYHFEGGDVIIDTKDNSLLSWTPTFTNYIGGGDISPLTTVRRIAGNVVDAGLSPAARLIRAYDKATGQFIGEGTSDGITGDFEFFVLSAELCTVFAIGEGGENAKIYDAVTPGILS